MCYWHCKTVLFASTCPQFSNMYLTILLFEPNNCVDNSLRTGAPTDKNQSSSRKVAVFLNTKLLSF